MVESYEPRWLQWAFNAQVSLFERVGLRTNIGKKVSMVYRPCQAAGTQSEAAYGRTMPGGGGDLTGTEEGAGRVQGMREGDGGRGRLEVF